MAKEVASFVGRGSSEEVMAEGQEPYEFWEILGGKGPYASDRRYPELRAPRLFVVKDLHAFSEKGKRAVTMTVPLHNNLKCTI